MIGSGRDSYDAESLTLLADFRDKLREERDLPENRVHGRNRRGITLVKRDGSVGTGPYTMEYRKELLSRLRTMQETVGDTLITPEEENRITQIWAEEQANLIRVMEGNIGGGE